MTKLLILPALLLPLLTVAQTDTDYTRFVNPFVGTKKMGHTFPGATVPFGMVQLSPDTDTVPYDREGKYNPKVYEYCSGYQYGDKTITGFSHTHFSGTGHSDLGDILIMPTIGALQLNPGTADHPETGYRSVFSHEDETASPGYYSVMLSDYGIRAELTATERVGVHQYTFPQSDNAHIILDLIHGIYNYDQKNVWSFLRMENDTLVTGYRMTSGWARTCTVYFAITFSKPVKSFGFKNFENPVYRGFWRKFDQENNFPEAAGRKIRAHFDFSSGTGEKIIVRVALSPVSAQGAVANLKAEAPANDFEVIRKRAHELWNRELGKTEAQFLNQTDRETFYTALYHSFIAPNLFMDVDGSYRGLDQNDHLAKGFLNYSTFSLWDTYRALHPLFNLLQPRRNSDMIQSMLAHYGQSVHHMLPVWSHFANENWCMIGYHAVSVIADAWMKGNRGFDGNKALDACVTSARNKWYDGLEYYIDKGFIPEDKNGSSVSKTLEYAYDDWAIAQLAGDLGRNEISDEFRKRSGYYRNVFDPITGFMRPRLNDGQWRKGFDPLSTNGQGFIEGNAWNYSLYVPHNVPELIGLMGGNKRLAEHLDSLFTMHLDDEHFAETEDITRDGIIGCYVHGNEPSHHVPYLYNYMGFPYKTQERVRHIMKTMYSNTPDGLCGNDDCGQMSAWYIFSALGFYPVCPGSTKYDLGSPLISSAILRLENGRTFVIEAKNQSESNVYVRQILLNGTPLAGQQLDHADIMNGGTLTFVMGDKPLKTKK